jgi:hypothetical protein
MGEYKLVSIGKSSKAGKKMEAKFMNKKTKRLKTTHFGAAGMDDYTLTKDKEQRSRYRSRHKKDLKGDPTRAGYLSYYILWGNSTSKRANIAAFKRRFF